MALAGPTGSVQDRGDSQRHPAARSSILRLRIAKLSFKRMTFIIWQNSSTQRTWSRESKDSLYSVVNWRTATASCSGISARTRLGTSGDPFAPLNASNHHSTETHWAPLRRLIKLHLTKERPKSGGRADAVGRIQGNTREIERGC